jgi:hypothetical protein
VKVGEALFGAQCQRFPQFGVGCARRLPKKMDEPDAGGPLIDKQTGRRGRIASFPTFQPHNPSTRDYGSGILRRAINVLNVDPIGISPRRAPR